MYYPAEGSETVLGLLSVVVQDGEEHAGLHLQACQCGILHAEEEEATMGKVASGPTSDAEAATQGAAEPARLFYPSPGSDIGSGRRASSMGGSQRRLTVDGRTVDHEGKPPTHYSSAVMHSVKSQDLPSTNGGKACLEDSLSILNNSPAISKRHGRTAQAQCAAESDLQLDTAGSEHQSRRQTSMPRKAVHERGAAHDQHHCGASLAHTHGLETHSGAERVSACPCLHRNASANPQVVQGSPAVMWQVNCWLL